MTVEDQDRYTRACHAMQSGVAAMMGTGEEQAAKQAEPKHLRVGINAALSSNGALAKLLIDKGIFTIDELDAAVADAMEEEVARYQKEVSEAYGVEVTLK